MEAFANAKKVDLIVTTPAHAESGWYQTGTYEETWQLWDTLADPQEVVSTATVGYDWVSNGPKVVLTIGAKDVVETPFDNRGSSGVGEEWRIPVSELNSLADEVVKADIVSVVSDLSAEPWLPIGDIVNSRGSTGYDANAGYGRSLEVEWQPYSVPYDFGAGTYDVVKTDPESVGVGSIDGIYQFGDWAAETPVPESVTIPWDATGYFWDDTIWKTLAFAEDTEGWAQTTNDTDELDVWGYPYVYADHYST